MKDWITLGTLQWGINESHGLKKELHNRWLQLRILCNKNILQLIWHRAKCISVVSVPKRNGSRKGFLQIQVHKSKIHIKKKNDCSFRAANTIYLWDGVLNDASRHMLWTMKPKGRLEVTCWLYIAEKHSTVWNAAVKNTDEVKRWGHCGFGWLLSQRPLQTPPPPRSPAR